MALVGGKIQIRTIYHLQIFSSGDFYSSENHRLLNNPLFLKSKY